MNTTVKNTTLQSLATALLTLGVATLTAGFSWAGVVEVVLGVGVYWLYEVTD